MHFSGIKTIKTAVKLMTLEDLRTLLVNVHSRTVDENLFTSAKN